MTALLSCSFLLLVLYLLPDRVQSIVGGIPAQPGEFPHHALIGWPREEEPTQYDFACGAALIHTRYALTAAHCGQGNPQIVRLGAHNLADPDDDHQRDVEIESFIKHPQHSFRSSYNDIALVKLKQEVASSRWIRPACLWKGSESNVSSVIATGFGVTQYHGDLSDVLRKVELNIRNRSLCEVKFNSLRQFPEGVLESQLCIGSERGGKDTCQGDAGGPVQVPALDSEQQCTYFVVGITSVGDICGSSESSAAIYTRVASYIDWIESVVKG